jgi:VanZ family protein
MRGGKEKCTTLERKQRMPSKRTALAIGWTLLILVLCWMPKSSMPLREDGPSFLPKIHADKIIHAGIFACFAILWRRASGRGSAGLIALSGLALAVITELGQSTTIVGRDGDVWDGLADTAGVLLGLAIAIWLERKRTSPVPGPRAPETSVSV